MVCSQPTYEELKPCRGFFNPTVLTGSQPTYEELKRPVQAVCKHLPDGSQPTYEELKRVRKTFVILLTLMFPAYL